jgi:N-acetylmuramoyl-L-alanine amidase
MNKRSLLLVCLFVLGLFGFLYVPVCDAQDSAPVVVKVRAARHQDYVRIVLTAEDTLVRTASVIFTKNKTIRIEFQPEGTQAVKGNPVISFATEKGVLASDMPVEIIKSVNLAAKGGACTITVANAEDIKVLKLQSPPRIVIDTRFTAELKEPAAVGPSIRPSADQIAFRYFVIDAGHGGYDYGIRGTHFVEKDFVLAFARELSGILSKSGKEVVLLRKNDQVMSLYERANLVNKRLPDVLISLHVSSTKVPAVYSVPAVPEGAVAGAEAAVGKAEEQKKAETARGIADSIAKSLEKEFSISVVRETIPLSLLARSKAPAVLIELPNPDEFSYEKRNRERLLLAIIKGLVGTKEEKQPAPVTKLDYKSDTKADNRHDTKKASKPEKI